MKKILLSTAVCATMMFASSDYNYEITPMFGSAFTEHNTDLAKGYSNAGLAIGFNQTNTVFDQIELGFLRSIEDVNYQNVVRDTGITRVFTNLIKDYELSSTMSLYALVGGGVEIFDDEFADNEDGVFGNYGAGLKMKVYNDISMKMDLRHAIEADNGDNTLLYNVGLAIPFGKIAKPAPVVEAPVVVPTPAPVVEAPKDSDNDGVIDSKDECPETMARVSVDSNGCATLVNLEINFDVDSSTIKNSYGTRIEEFAKMMKANPKIKATIEAHTDSTGSDKYNQKLSDRRAKSTVDYLKSLNVDSTKLSSIGYGETRPVATNATKEGRAQNRRVTAVMSK